MEPSRPFEHGSESGARYDWLAHEMARLPPAAYSLTAITGAILGFLLFGAYPRFMGYPTDTFALCLDSGIGYVRPTDDHGNDSQIDLNQ